jgi:hypothetical protein
MKRIIKRFLQWYRPGAAPAVILFASPRGGSTWVTELIASQPGFWPFSEPLNVRSKWVQRELGITSHADLYSAAALPKVRHYYERLLSGKFHELKLMPGKPFYKSFTNRIVVKENQGLLDRMAWFEATFGVQVIHLLRHPVPVALSREVFPLLDGFSGCALRKQFTAEQLELADALIDSGSHLERGVLAWCLHHGPALRENAESWLTLTYEETVLQPDRVIELLATRLNLPSRARMERQCSRPSRVARKSNIQTQQLLASGKNREQLIQKWQKQVSESDLVSVQRILNVFAIDLYSADQVLPASLRT